MCHDNDQTPPPPPEFDFSAFPGNTLFHDRRNGRERRKPLSKKSSQTPEKPKPTGERRAKTERRRRRRIDPTTFDKEYTDDEMEFMNAVQRYKEQSGKSFPTYREVIKVAALLGYRLVVDDPCPLTTDNDTDEVVSPA